MDERLDMVSITVLIAGRPYPLKIKDTDEPSIRKIVKEVNDKINQFQLTYTTKDKQDCLAMVALTYAVDAMKQKESSGDDPQTSSSPAPAIQRLSELDRLLESLLN